MPRWPLLSSVCRSGGGPLGWAALALAIVALAGCGGGNARSPADAAVQAIAEANERLKGDWVLVQFQPTVPLEPMLATLLAVQLNHLTVRFDGTHAFAAGVGVQATRTYRVHDAYGDRFKMTLYDEANVPYESACQFADGVVNFEARTSPWTGKGTFQKVGGAGR